MVLLLTLLWFGVSCVLLFKFDRVLFFLFLVDRNAGGSVEQINEGVSR